MSFLFDILMLALPCLACRRGYKNGIIQGGIRLFLLIVSVIAAAKLTPVLQPVLTEALPLPGAGTKLVSYISVSLLEDPDSDVCGLLQDFGFSEDAAEKMSTAIESRSEAFVRSRAQVLSEAVDSMLTEAIVFVFLFIFFSFVSLFLNILIGRVFEFTAVSKIDKTLGMVLHGVSALALVFVICCLVRWTFPLVDAALDINLTGLVVDRSVVLKLTEKINPFFIIFS